MNELHEKGLLGKAVLKGEEADLNYEVKRLEVERDVLFE
jgi:hypothetical protein